MDIQEALNVELKPITVSLGNLLLDPNNFRLAETLPTRKDEEFIDLQQETLAKILKGYGVQDLESSILNHGWLDVDQIVVRKLRTAESIDPPKFVVVEGNRRIAALINLVSDFKERQLDLPQSLASANKALRVMLIEGSDEEVDHASEVIMGIRHVGGPRKWGGLQAAMMVVRLVDEKKFSVSQAGERLGISGIEANRRYRSYKAYMQAREDGHTQSNLFTLLGEAIRIKSLREWLDWDDKESRFKNDESLDLFYEKLGLNDDENNGSESSTDKQERLTNPQSVRDLRHIIEHPIAREVFAKTRSIETAKIISSENDLSAKSSLISHCEKIIEALLEDETVYALTEQEKEILERLSSLIVKKLGGVEQ